MEEARVLAMTTKQPAAAIAALTAKAKLAGLWVGRRENLNRSVDPDKLTDAEIAKLGGPDYANLPSGDPPKPKWMR